MSSFTPLPHQLPLPLLDLSIQLSRLRPDSMASQRSNRHQKTRYREWKPECGHYTMTRVYHPSLQCAICRRGSRFGWMYRCTVDKEALITKAKLRGEDASNAKLESEHRVAFDQLGRAFSEQMSLGKRSADSRTRKYAFLDEITAAELSTYTPEQLATILSQRDELVEAIAKERRQSGGVLSDAGYKYSDDQKPWMPDESQECRFVACPFCQNIAKDKSWVSLNGVLRGDIPPTVATAYAFSSSRSRPCMDVKLVRNLGCRPVCFPEQHPVSVARRRAGLKDQFDSWFTSDDEFSRNIDITAESSDEDCPSDSSDDFSEAEEVALRHWTYFPDPKFQEFRSNQSALGKNSWDLDSNHLVSSSPDPIRLPRSPPPTPLPLRDGKSSEGVHTDERSPSYLKTNSMVRNRPFSCFPSISAVLQQESNCDQRPEEPRGVVLCLPLSDNVLERACGVPLPRPDMAEKLLFAKGRTYIGDSRISDTLMPSVSQGTVPAVVGSPSTGIAVARITEESVEDGTPDLVLSVEGEAETAGASWSRN